MENGHDSLTRLVAQVRRAVLDVERHRGKPQRRRVRRVAAV